MDWFSRYVLAWEVFTTLETGFCFQALEEAVGRSSPQIFNTDQRSQFTSVDFTSRVGSAAIQMSIDGRGRVYDNSFVERLWRSVKYEEVHLQDYQSVREARERLGDYFLFYNTERRHEGLGYPAPCSVYFKEGSGQHTQLAS